MKRRTFLTALLATPLAALFRPKPGPKPARPRYDWQEYKMGISSGGVHIESMVNLEYGEDGFLHAIDRSKPVSLTTKPMRFR